MGLAKAVKILQALKGNLIAVRNCLLLFMFFHLVTLKKKLMFSFVRKSFSDSSLRVYEGLNF